MQALCLLLALTLLQLVSSSLNTDTDEQHYMVALKESQAPFTVLMKPLRAILNKDPNNTIIKEYAHLYGFLARIQDKTVLDKLNTFPQVESIRMRQPFQVTSHNGVAHQSNPLFWNLDVLDGPDGEYHYRDSSVLGNVVVYVLDTGVNPHVEFRGRNLLRESVIDGVDAYDRNGHGTHVAGTIAGSLAGVAKKIQIASIKVLNDNCQGIFQDVVEGIDRAIKHHKERRENNPRAASVINMSLEGPASEVCDRAVRKAVASGITVVIAAGNDGSDACSKTPARVKEVITVAASDSGYHLSSYSNRGSCVDLIAPGDSILSASAFKQHGYVRKSGTSMAAPHVAGAAALILEKYPTASPADVAKMLKQLAKPNIIKLTGGKNLNSGTKLDRETPNLFLQVPSVQ